MEVVPRHGRMAVEAYDMEITGKYLLNSAESIVRGRRAQEPKGTEADQRSAPSTAVESGWQARLLAMQGTLGEMQRVYSREQARHNYLQEHFDEITRDLHFDGEPLFPDIPEKPDRKTLLFGVEERLKELRTQLKSVQVEMENHLALQFASEKSLGLDHLDLSAGLAGSRLDPERVARLTRPDPRA